MLIYGKHAFVTSKPKGNSYCEDAEIAAKKFDDRIKNYYFG